MAETILRELRDAASRNDRAKVAELTDELLATFDQRRARGEAIQHSARTVREGVGRSDEEVRSAAEFVLTERNRADEAKINVDRALYSYLFGGEAAPVVDAVDEAIDAFQALDDAVERLQDVEPEEQVLPPIVSLTLQEQVVVPKGQQIDSSFTIRNDGQEAVENLSLDIGEMGDLSLSPATIDRLEPGKQVGVEIVGAPSPDTYEPTIAVTGPDGDQFDSDTFYLHVRDKRRYLVQAIGDLVTLYEDIATAAALAEGRDVDREPHDTDNQNGQSDGSGTGFSDEDQALVPSGIDSKMRTIAERTLDTLRRIQHGQNERPIDNRIGATINQIGALSNQLDALAGKKLDEASTVRLQRDLEDVVDVYETAREAGT